MQTNETASFPAWVIAALNGTAAPALQPASAAPAPAAGESSIEPAAPAVAPAKRSRKGKGKRPVNAAAPAAVDPEALDPASIDLPALECHSLPDCSAGSVQVDTLS